MDQKKKKNWMNETYHTYFYNFFWKKFQSLEKFDKHIVVLERKIQALPFYPLLASWDYYETPVSLVILLLLLSL